PLPPSDRHRLGMCPPSSPMPALCRSQRPPVIALYTKSKPPGRPRPSSPPMARAPSSCVAHRPELHVKTGIIPRNVEGEGRRIRQPRPQFGRLVELEIDRIAEERQSAWRHRQRRDRHAGKLQVDEIADLLDRPDLDLRRKLAAQVLARLLGGRQQDEAVALEN